MSFWLWALLILLSVIALIWFIDALLVFFLYERSDFTRKHYVKTGDGAEIDLYYYSAEDGTPNRETPVLLVHGLSANHRNLAFDQTVGLAQYLNQLGYDCWAVGLRGRGLTFGGDWGFDDYVREDLPAAIRYIQEKSGQQKVHWIGHSMGGMAFMATAGSLGMSDAIEKGVTIGSPVYFRGFHWLKSFGLIFGKLPRLLRNLISGAMSVAADGLTRILPWRLLFLIVLESRFSARAWKVVYNVVVPTIQPRVIYQFIRWTVTGEWTSQDQRDDYREGLKLIETPTLMVVGDHDRFCPNCEIAGAQLLRDTYSECLHLSRENGANRNYDHLELVFSRDAPDDVFSSISDWLEKDINNSE